jgi:hypothetical protein
VLTRNLRRRAGRPASSAAAKFLILLNTSDGRAVLGRGSRRCGHLAWRLRTDRRRFIER